MVIHQNPARWFTPGRLGNPINKIYIHHAATTDFDGIGRTFRGNREVSAHYGVGRDNNVDQYVQEGSIAWHCGNWALNCTSIGIENVNLTGGPEWRIADSTFNTLVDLVFDIAKRHNMLPLVVGKNLLGHKDVVPTICPGALYPRLQELANKVNEKAKVFEPLFQKSYGQIVTDVIAGKYGNGEDRKRNLANAGYDYTTIQNMVNARLGVGGMPTPIEKPSVTSLAQQVLAGAWGNGDERRNRLQSAGHNYDEVQGEVNRLVGVSSAPSQPPRKSLDQVATEVIRGEWGNGQDRRNRLQAAGYDYNAVQNLVNRKL